MISSSIYSQVVTAYSNAADHGETMLAELTNMGVEVRTLSANNSVIVSSIILAQNTLKLRNAVSPLMVFAVKRLQLHVATNAGSVNSYLNSNTITVTQTFADISELAGYPISPTYISN